MKRYAKSFIGLMEQNTVGEWVKYVEHTEQITELTKLSKSKIMGLETKLHRSNYEVWVLERSLARQSTLKRTILTLLTIIIVLVATLIGKVYV